MENLNDLEAQRLEINKKLKKSLFILIPITIIAVIIMANLSFFYMYDFLPLFFSTVIYKNYKKNISKEFNKGFKTRVITALITQIDPNLKYQKDNFIKYDDFFYPGIYTKTYDYYYYGNDLIFGNIKGVDLRFSDIFVKKEEIIYDSDGHAQKRIINIFSGIFFIADFNKNFTSKTIIIDEKSKYANISMQKANMDNFEFEKKFNVYTNDQINARYILSPVFMEQFTKIRNSFNCPVNACFLDNKIYIYIERGFDSFEADLKKSLVGENSSIQHYKLEVLKFIDLVVNLKLNNTIFKF